MCGIAGFLASNATPNNTNLIQSMMECMNHRGPDNLGVWQEDGISLGHNRLSIIDLTDDGNQPMHYENLVITFNGEIYNYIELKDELINLNHSFSTTCDTEVLIAAYKEWGQDCVKKFIGMWAFAIWDKDTKTLFCSRDRFGIKPFYYISENDAFYFASEVKALKKVPTFSRELNLNQMSLFLQLGYYYNHDETLYLNVKQIPPAHNLLIENGKITVTEYWDVNSGAANGKTYEEKCSEFKTLFYESIKLHTRSDVQVGANLSGGIDSSSIVSVYSTMFAENKLETFNIFYEGKDGVDERPWIRFLEKKYPNINGHFLSPKDSDLEEHFHAFMECMEFPTNGSSPFSQYFVMQLANKNGIKVLLNGQGSDEYLAGYMHSMYRLLADYLGNKQFGKFSKHLKNHLKNQSHGAKKSIDIILKTILTALQSEQNLYEIEYNNYYPNLFKNKIDKPIKIKEFKGSRLDQFLYHQTLQTSLPNLLHQEDATSMAFSIESRVPFLDHRLIEYAFTLNNEDKIYEGVTKRILRDALKEELPKEIAGRLDKKGFVTPGEVKWLKGSLSYLLDIDWKELSFLDSKKGNKVIEDYKKGNLKNSMFVWRLGVLNYWMKNIR